MIKSDRSKEIIQEIDAAVRERMLSRQAELAELRGFRKKLRRIKIELWAWMKVMTTKRKKKP